MSFRITGYRPSLRLLHWLVAVLVILMLPVGTVMVMEGISRPLMDTLFILHKHTGVAILILMVLRLAWRLFNPPTPLPDTMPGWQKLAAGTVHLGLYVMVFFMAITGYIRVSTGGFPIEGLNALGLHPLLPRNEAVADLAQTAHFYGRYLLALLIAAHVGAALHHAIILRDGIWSRIWPIRPR